MAETPRWQQLVVYGALLAIVLVVGVSWLGRDSAAGEPAAARPPVAALQVEDEQEPKAAVVHVAGAVRRPGVYRLRAGARVNEAVRRAGGATARADLSQVNLAARVEDGRQVLVPARPPRGAAAAASAGGSAAGVAAGVPVNLNTATLEQLDELDGVGPATAEKILAYRQRQGGFGSVEELAQVPGIGERRLAALRDLVRV